MKTKLVNAFCTVMPALLPDRVIYCGENDAEKDVEVYRPFDIDGHNGSRIYLPDMLDEDVLELACDHIFNAGATAIVRASYCLEEAGTVDVRYKLSPIMLLHKLGVLDRCIIVGGVCLDNDDLDLMAQEGVPLVITPTASAGYGHGYAPVCTAIKRGVRVGIGTFDGKYNSGGDLIRELCFLRLTANAQMSMENALSEEQIASISAFELYKE